MALKFTIEDTVPLIVWSTVEQTVTLVCIGIPNLRRLYKHTFGTGLSSESYLRYDEGSDRHEHELSAYAKRSRSTGDSNNESELNLSTRIRTEIEGASKGGNESDDYAGGQNTMEPASSLNRSHSVSNAIYVQKDVNIRWTSQ